MDTCNTISNRSGLWEDALNIGSQINQFEVTIIMLLISKCNVASGDEDLDNNPSDHLDTKNITDQDPQSCPEYLVIS